MLIEDGVIRDLSTKRLPMSQGDRFLDYTGKLIIPGFADMHLHAPQFPNMGLGTDMELLEWLTTYTFPEEAKYRDVDYARRIYKSFVNTLWSVGTLYSGVYGSIHQEATSILYDLFVQSGLYSLVGKVNMDRNAPDYYVEDTEESIRETQRFVTENLHKSERVKPIVTPRFVPTCTPALMQALGELAERYAVPVQSHLDENKSEIAWVCELHPDSESYSQVYKQYKLFGEQPTLMGHCIYCSEEELALMERSDVMAVHCPFSIANLISGIMPVKQYLKRGIKVGLGSDVSGGSEINMAKVAVLSMQLSKMLAVFNNQPDEFLSTPEAFYLATRAGGEFFGRHGSLECGFAADFLVVDDEPYRFMERSVEERLEKFLYRADERHILHRFVAGEVLPKPFDI